MVLNDGYNMDKRGSSVFDHLARGHRGASITVNVADAATTGNQNFVANGKLYGLLIDIPAVTGATSQITDIDIYPQDATNDEAKVVNLSTLTLAENTVHFVDLPQNAANNLTPVLFGHHNIKLTLDNAPSGADVDITVVPILGRH